MSQLTPGAIHGLLEGRNDKPIVQVLEVNKRSTQSERGRLTISDGAHYLGVVLNSQLKQLEEKISSGCIIRILSSVLHPTPQKKVVVLSKLEILSNPVATIGEPVPGPGHSSGQPAAAQPQSNHANIPPVKTQTHQQQDYKPQNQTSNYTNNYNRPQVKQQQQQDIPTHLPPVVPIKSLNPYQSRWTLKVRVSSKTAIKTWSNAKSSGKLFSVDLVDEHGGEIRATAFQDAVDALYDLLEQGGVYFISKAQLKAIDASRRQYNPIKNDFELSMDVNTIIQPCTDHVNIPRVHYNFVNIDDIQSINKDSLIDVVGIITDLNDPAVIKTKLGESTKRTLTLLDSTASIELTLWGPQAEKFPLQVGNVLTAKGVKVSDFNGKSLSSLSSSVFEIDPEEEPRSQQLRLWYSENCHNPGLSTIKQLSTHSRRDGGSYSSNSNNEGASGLSVGSRDPLKFFSQIKDERLGMDTTHYFVTRGTVVNIKHDDNTKCWYDACPTCNKKMTSVVNGQWHCDKCNEDGMCRQRYILSLSAGDFTGSNWLSCFDDTGKIILNIDAPHLAELKDTNPPQYAAVFNDALFKSYKFKIRAKAETYQDEQRVKCNVTGVEPTDFVKDSKWLLSEIAKDM